MLFEYNPGDPFQPGGYLSQGTKSLLFNKNDLNRNPVTPWDFQANPDDEFEPWEFEFFNEGTPETAQAKSWTDYAWGWAITLKSDVNLLGSFSFSSPMDVVEHLHVGEINVKAVYVGDRRAKSIFIGNKPILYKGAN